MKNKFNISRLIIQFFAVMLFIAATQPASGQEYIREEILNNHTDTSIVRNVNNDTVLMYNYNYNNTTPSAFMLVESGNNSVTTWYIDPVIVNDFEVVGNLVNFCGYMIVEDMKKAVFGTFSLAAFGNRPLNCHVLDSCAELKKLDYYQYTEGPSYNQHYEDHLVMTGARSLRSDVIVDVIVGANTYAPPFTICSIYYSDNDYESFDDVAATDKHVVVSTRTRVEGDPVVDFWQFDKPSASWTYILPSNVKHLTLGSPASDTPIILEHIEAENYAATYKMSGYPYIVMLRMSTDSINVKTVIITGGLNNAIIPMDIKYNSVNQVFDILARNPNSREEIDETGLRLIPMQIYHITPYIFSGSPYGNGTNFTNPYYHLWSIDPTRTSYFVASGDRDYRATLIGYSPTQWVNCPQSFIYTCLLLKLTGIRSVDKKNTRAWDAEDVKMETSKININFPYVCH